MSVMTASTRDNTKKARKPRAKTTGALLGVRLQPNQLAALDAWIAAQPEPVSRPEAVRRLVERGLKA